MTKFSGNLQITLTDKDGFKHDISNQINTPFYEVPQGNTILTNSCGSLHFSFTRGKSYLKTLRGRHRWWKRWLRGKR